MEFLGIGFVVLCYFFGKAALVKQQNLREIVALLRSMPNGEHKERAIQALEAISEK